MYQFVIYSYYECWCLCEYASLTGPQESRFIVSKTIPAFAENHFFLILLAKVCVCICMYRKGDIKCESQFLQYFLQTKSDLLCSETAVEHGTASQDKYTHHSFGSLCLMVPDGGV